MGEPLTLSIIARFLRKRNQSEAMPCRIPCRMRAAPPRRLGCKIGDSRGYGEISSAGSSYLHQPLHLVAYLSSNYPVHSVHRFQVMAES